MEKKKKYIYLLFTDTGTFLTQLIRLYTHAPYNHASIALDAGLHRMYSFGRKKPFNPIIGGFVREDANDGLYAYLPHMSCTVYRIEVTQRQYEKCERLIRHFEKNEKHYWYNYLGLLGVALRIGSGIRGTYFCSEFVADVLRRAGVATWKKEPSRMTPEDLRTYSGCEKVYEGALQDYPHLDKNRAEDKKWKSIRRLFVI